MSAILPVELHEGDEVELQIRLPSGTEGTRAIVRQRSVYRRGSEFAQPLDEISATPSLPTGGMAHSLISISALQLSQNSDPS